MEVYRRVTVTFTKEDDSQPGWWEEVPRSPFYRAEKSILPFRLVVEMSKPHGTLAMKTDHVKVTGHATNKSGNVTLNVRTEDYWGSDIRDNKLPAWVAHAVQVAEMVRD